LPKYFSPTTTMQHKAYLPIIALTQPLLRQRE
jgi:hypothetical protein